MSIFKRKTSLKKRVESLEEYLGVVFVVKPGYDYAEHQEDSEAYRNTPVVRLKNVEKQLEDKKGRK